MDRAKPVLKLEKTSKHTEMIKINTDSDPLFTQDWWSDDESVEETDRQPEQDRTQHVGDPLQEENETGTLRLYFQNLNGIKWNKHGGSWPQPPTPTGTTAVGGLHAEILQGAFEVESGLR